MPLEVEMRELGGRAFSLGEWFVEPSLNRLSTGDTTIQLELKVMDVLVCLAERAGEVVTRQEIVDRVWATEFISDNTLTHAITEIRNALGDDARNPSFIETIHRRGYRLIVPVEAAVSDELGNSRVARFPVPERPAPQSEGRNPYPGLAAFTEADAEFFFGREAEVAQMWRKLTSRRLLAVIGPSGVGKSSFLRAGVIPARPEGWGVVVCQPGEAPFAALARALVPEFAGDDDAISNLVGLGTPEEMAVMVGRWRQQHYQSLLIVDQFEELFTLNAADTQGRFADLLRRLVDDADVHVLLSMRDDFLHRCHDHDSLAPIFEILTPVRTPAESALHRALIEPAAQLGFTFEDEDLAGEMISEVEGERGALPLLAFAISRLWEKRDREQKLITRQAYSDIGGVAGALARHAEATIDRIGTDRIAVARELFRNLVTAEGTRAVREWNELLSIFSVSHSESPEEVLRQLIDSRLLTSYEVRTDDEAPTRSVEVVHESLLSSWPRLVRWQTQDADAAQLRDQLRQAARTWDEHDRTRDYLWTGRAYREFALWRGMYPGGLTAVEEDFAVAMTAHNKRRRRRRRLAVAAAFFVLLAVLAVVGVSRQQAIAEANRAEGAKLLALAEVLLDADPTEALAFATASLELADTYESRIFAMRALWAGPPLRALDLEETAGSQFAVPAFSPDGRWLAVAGLANENVLVYGENGGGPIVLGGHAESHNGSIWSAWSRDGLLVTGHFSAGRARIWAMPMGRLVREIDVGGAGFWQVGDTHLFAAVREEDTISGRKVFRLRSWQLPDGGPEELGTVDRVGGQNWFDPGARAWIYAKGDGIYSCPLPVRIGVPDRVIARHSSDEPRVWGWGRPHGLYSNDSGGEIVLWTTAEGTSVPGRRLRKPETATVRLRPEPSGRWVVDSDDEDREGKVSLWGLSGLVGARPQALRRNRPWYFSFSDFHPGGGWVVATTSDLREVSFWPLQAPSPQVVDGYETWLFRPVDFTPDGRHLVTHWGQDRVRLWPLPGAGDRDVVDLKLPFSGSPIGLAVDPTGKNALSTGDGRQTFLVSLTGAEPLRLEGLGTDIVTTAAFSPSGRLVAAASAYSESRPTLRVWDLSSGESRVFDQPHDPQAERFTLSLAFVDETTLYTSGSYGLLRWDLEAGTYERILEAPPGGEVWFCMASDRRMSLVYERGPFPALNLVGVALHDLKTGDVRGLDIPGEGPSVALSPDGTTWAAGEKDGSIWIGRTDGGEAHLLTGHRGPVDNVAISPDNKWIASSGEDKTLRLWPMPDLSKPPLHTLPHEELIAKLRSLTNLRAVRDPEASTGWKIEVGPFPGWADVPEW